MLNRFTITFYFNKTMRRNTLAEGSKNHPNQQHQHRKQKHPTRDEELEPMTQEVNKAVAAALAEAGFTVT